MQYILHNKGCGNIYYVQITAGGSLKKVRERSLATIFQSQSEADNIKHKYKKKLKTYKLEPITVQKFQYKIGKIFLRQTIKRIKDRKKEK